MPEITRFFGIVVRMMFDDHSPPHFHAEYNEHQVLIGIGDLRLLEGDFPPRALALVMEWAKTHQSELLEDWNLAKSGKSVFKIEPLR